MTRACQPVPAEYPFLLMTCAMTLQWACQPCACKKTSELASPGRLIWTISNSNVLALARIHKHSPYILLRSGTKAKTRGESSANFVNATDEQVASMWISVYLVCKLGLCVYKWHSMQHIFISLVGWKYSCTVRKASRTRRFESEGAPQWAQARESRPQVAHVHIETTLQSIQWRPWRFERLRRYTGTARQRSFFPLIKFNYAIGAAFSGRMAWA
jgi:hypothetical protein